MSRTAYCAIRGRTTGCTHMEFAGQRGDLDRMRTGNQGRARRGALAGRLALAVAFAFLGAIFMGAAPALAADVSVSGTTATFTAVSGETNTVTMAKSGNDLVITDSTAFITTSTG